MTSLIHAITKAKKNLIAPQRMSFEERLKLVESLILHLQLKNKSLPKSDSVNNPTGVVVGIIPEVSPIAHLAEFLLPALIAGNSVILNAQASATWTKDLSDFIAKFQEENSFYQQDLLQIVSAANADEFEILTSHPAVNAIYGAGSSEVFLNLMKSTPFQTKKHFWRGSSNNSFLVLADANLSEAFECFWNSVKFENGLHPTATKKLLLLESQLPEFKVWLAKKTTSEFDNRSLDETIIKIKAEDGKILLQGNPTIVLDLPHCSEFQQAEISLPLALVSTVKYSHEMAKWNNTGQFAMAAVVFGSEDKARAIAKKLDVGTIWINRSYNPEVDLLPLGNKLSHFGFKDLSFDGDFFSDQQSIF